MKWMNRRAKSRTGRSEEHSQPKQENPAKTTRQEGGNGERWVIRVGKTLKEWPLKLVALPEPPSIGNMSCEELERHTQEALSIALQEHLPDIKEADRLREWAEKTCAPLRATFTIEPKDGVDPNTINPKDRRTYPKRFRLKLWRGLDRNQLAPVEAAPDAPGVVIEAMRIAWHQLVSHDESLLERAKQCGFDFLGDAFEAALQIASSYDPGSLPVEQTLSLRSYLVTYLLLFYKERLYKDVGSPKTRGKKGRISKPGESGAKNAAPLFVSLDTDPKANIEALRRREPEHGSVGDDFLNRQVYNHLTEELDREVFILKRRDQKLTHTEIAGYLNVHRLQVQRSMKRIKEAISISVRKPLPAPRFRRRGGKLGSKAVRSSKG